MKKHQQGKRTAEVSTVINKSDYDTDHDSVSDSSSQDAADGFDNESGHDTDHDSVSEDDSNSQDAADSFDNDSDNDDTDTEDEDEDTSNNDLQLAELTPPTNRSWSAGFFLTLATLLSFLRWNGQETDSRKTPAAPKMKQLRLPNSEDYLSLSRRDVYQLLNTPFLLQQLIANGELTITLVTPGQNPIYQATLLGYSTEARIIRKPDDTQALQIGEMIIPLDLLTPVLAPLPSSEETELDGPLPLSLPQEPVSTSNSWFGRVVRPFQNIYHSITETAEYYLHRNPADWSDEEIEELEEREEIEELEEELPTTKDTNLIRGPAVPTEPVVAAQPGVFEVDYDIHNDDTDDDTASNPSTAENNDETSPAFYFEEHLVNLDVTIQNIINVEIRQKATAVRDRLVAIYPKSANKKELTHCLDFTNRLLRSSPGEERNTLAARYLELATTTRSSRSPVLQALGVAMMLLGLVVTSLGGALCLSPAPIGVAGILGGLGLFATGVSMFNSGRPNYKTAELMNDLQIDILNSSTNGPLISSNGPSS